MLPEGLTSLRELNIHQAEWYLCVAILHHQRNGPLAATDKTSWSSATLDNMVTDMQLAKIGKEEANSYVSNRDDVSEDDLMNPGQERPFKKLKSIKINCLSIPDEELAVLVENADALHKLSVPGSQAGPKTSDSLQRHFDRIVELNVRNCPFDSKSVMTVMENSPRLQILAATQLSAQDVIQSGAWVCTRLQRLQAEIVMSGIKSETDARAENQGVFERLSALSQIEVLDTQSVVTGADNSVPQLSVDYGLDCLSTLKGLRELRVGGDSFMRTGLEDAMWMMDQ
ncbi:hypothetical protein BG006_002297 [Podila minutissima]|uniref:Uncharacterized protein n=1 Tax=Podila minutissima TaxID=64525 RepID=A0A9P5VP23_9FUNG|nr:hypothetical protein BG006_002297 [Podila minutissima]